MVKITASLVKELREITGAGMMDCKKALTSCEGDFEASKELLRKKGQLIANKRAAKETSEGALCVSLKGNKATMVKVGCETDFVARNGQFLDFIQKLSEQALEKGSENFTQEGLKEQFNEIVSKMGENILLMGAEFWEIPEGHRAGSYTHTNKKIATLVELSFGKPMDNVEAQEVICKDIAMHIAASEVKAVSEDDLDPALLEKERKFLTEQAKESGKPDNIIPKMIEGRLKKFKKEVCLLDQNFVKDPEKTIRQYLSASGKELGVNIEVVRFHKNII